MNYFETLNAINVNDFTEKKGNLTYLSWAHAWKEFKKLFPKSFYTIYENAAGMNYHTDGKTCWVKTGVTLVNDDGEALEHIEYLPVMDYKNNSILLDVVKSTDINKAIQRSLTKAVARHGLGLYIYAGEDLPDEADGTAAEREKEAAELNKKVTAAQAKTLEQLAEECGADKEKMLEHYKVSSFADMTAAQYGDALTKLKAKKDKK